jgi:tRNA U34 5-carboxymethylaminomethyl modifying enzyme MnmG/GidA
MEVKIEFKASSDNKSDWLANHTLTKEQVVQLIRNKIERAKIYQQSINKVKTLVKES